MSGIVEETDGLIPFGRLVVGMDLPIQGGSRPSAEPWEPSGRARALEAIVRKADAAGFFYLAVGDHIAVPAAVAPELGTTWYEPSSTLGWVAALTQRTRLLLDDFVLAWRHPLLVAKSVSTLDALSQGRVILGLGTRAAPAEFDMLGVPYAQREQLLDDGLEVLRHAFAEEYPTVSTPSWDIAAAGLSPRPAQDHLPIWIAGSSAAAVRRAAERGDGWMATDADPESLRQHIALLRQHRADHRRGAPIDVGALAAPMYVGTPAWDVGSETRSGGGESLAAHVLDLAALGANNVRIRLRSRSAEELLDQLERFGHEVIPLLDPGSQTSERYEEPPFEEIARLSRLQVAAMEASSSDENAWGAIGNDLLLLTTKGRRTGRDHKVALAFWRDPGGCPILVGSYAGAPRHPDWYLNLANRQVNPQVKVQVRDRTFLATTQELEGAEYDQTWRHLTLDRPSYRSYSTRTDRRFALVRLNESPTAMHGEG